MLLAVTLLVDVAITEIVVLGVVVTVVKAGVSRQVHTDATKEAAWDLRLLNAALVGLTARASSSPTSLF